MTNIFIKIILTIATLLVSALIRAICIEFFGHGLITSLVTPFAFICLVLIWRKKQTHEDKEH